MKKREKFSTLFNYNTMSQQERIEFLLKLDFNQLVAGYIRKFPGKLHAVGLTVKAKEDPLGIRQILVTAIVSDNHAKELEINAPDGAFI